MEHFRLEAKITITVYTTVLAETIEQAIVLAEEERQPMGITKNSFDTEESCWMCYELDGDPYEIKTF